ncbi:pyrimidine-nucleoside phosphorylase [Alkaliphilus peptidifermentans]|uniref:Pyrimidine-nucleoside phosphorylase n=1 Tax=Alkaliphilus peptidifermentans DSM 18978 TaxID=1120976 RepID=A0A1G5KEG8_9FIRM|nr:pyrimidine-nucleoside phosphorylase [Alkaliphilus peptidifermentans]SCY99025.1 thymidine phosphorylase [Alkaliphilus peptidifermentans DSM 18978]
MGMVDIIKKKKNGEALTKEEINYFVKEYTEGNIPDYQAAALLMAIYFQKMNQEETAFLTEAMMHSGKVVDLSAIDGIKVDKHSTGGVGDKTTIALGAMVAACGVPVAKMSGRGLGHTGGTIDKLESFPGFSVELSIDDFIHNVNDIKIAVVGQTQDLAPADKTLYALRDVTSTVDNLSLIASSVMSKKLAAGADAILLDVKTGNGAFMKEIDDSFALAKEMVAIGSKMKRDTIAVITDMEQPLGFAVGNSLEVIEAIETLKGNGPADFTELCITLGSYMLLLAKKVSTVQQGRAEMEKVISNRKALEVLKTFIERQGGDGNLVDNPELLPKAKNVYILKSNKDGYIHGIHAETVGLSALLLGAGRETKASIIDLSVGIVFRKKAGDEIMSGEPLAEIHYNDEVKFQQALEKLKSAYTIETDKPIVRPLVYGIVTVDGVERL